MPIMCIICGAKKNPNQPEVTLHRFPQNERIRKKWLEVIGKSNFNPTDEVICSLHFKESSFTRTMHHTRLHFDAVPMSTNLTTLPVCQLFEDHETDDSRIKLGLFLPADQPDDPQSFVDNTISEEEDEAPELEKLRKLCARQKKQVKRLQLQVVTRNRKIEDLIKVIKLLKQRKDTISQMQQK